MYSKYTQTLIKIVEIHGVQAGNLTNNVSVCIASKRVPTYLICKPIECSECIFNEYTSNAKNVFMGILNE